MLKINIILFLILICEISSAQSSRMRCDMRVEFTDGVVRCLEVDADSLQKHRRFNQYYLTASKMRDLNFLLAKSAAGVSHCVQDQADLGKCVSALRKVISQAQLIESEFRRELIEILVTTQSDEGAKLKTLKSIATAGIVTSKEIQARLGKQLEKLSETYKQLVVQKAVGDFMTRVRQTENTAYCESANNIIESKSAWLKFVFEAADLTSAYQVFEQRENILQHRQGIDRLEQGCGKSLTPSATHAKKQAEGYLALINKTNVKQLAQQQCKKLKKKLTAVLKEACAKQVETTEFLYSLDQLARRQK